MDNSSTPNNLTPRPDAASASHDQPPLSPPVDSFATQVEVPSQPSYTAPSGTTPPTQPVSASSAPQAPSTQGIPLGTTAQNQTIISGAIGSDERTSRKFIRFIFPLAALLLIVGGIVGVMFFAKIGIFSEERFSAGDYTVAVDTSKWNASTGSDGKSLVLISKDDYTSGIGLLSYDDVTYEMISSEGAIDSIFKQMNGVKIQNQSERNIEGSKCQVVEIKYTTATYSNNEGIKAFCENSDNVLFLVEAEAPTQSGLDENLHEGVKIIKTAKRA